MKASEDRTIPRRDIGKVPWNYYCRGWNEKQQKYCRSRAGAGTTHPGIGRCKMHGGLQADDGRLTQHGRYSAVQTVTMQTLIARHASDPDPLNVAEDLAVLRAALELLLGKTPGDEGKLGDVVAFVDSTRGVVDAISKVVHRVEVLKTAGAVSLDQVRRFLGAVDRVLQHRVEDEDLRAKIRSEIYAIRV